MKKVVITVEFIAEVNDNVTLDEVCLGIKSADIPVINFDNQNHRIGKVESYSTIDISSLDPDA